MINTAGVAPPVATFPETIADLVNLSLAKSNALLLHYGLPAVGTIHAKRRRLAAHLGVRGKLLV